MHIRPSFVSVSVIKGPDKNRQEEGFVLVHNSRSQLSAVRKSRWEGPSTTIHNHRAEMNTWMSTPTTSSTATQASSQTEGMEHPQWAGFFLLGHHGMETIPTDMPRARDLDDAPWRLSSGDSRLCQDGLTLTHHVVRSKHTPLW